MNALRSRPLVLMYHAVGERAAEEDPFCLFVPQDRLHQQLATLLARGWTPLTLDAYLHGAHPSRSLLVTFDDGYRSVLDEGLPVLRELKVPATVFVLGGLLGGTSRWMAEMPDEPLLDAEGVRELAGAGLDVECHGWEHSTLLNASPEALVRNTTQAARVLTDLTGRPPRAFAYPYGDHDAPARRAVAEAGFEIAFSTYQAEGRFATPRVAVSPTDTSATFRLKVLPAYPAMRRIAGHVPKLRPAAHSLIGRAPRNSSGSSGS
ncbi:polysaccharide deacetylase family protein [Streptomyces massasporeus]|uniref:polysaccharide deacetylase family protein n=1 Tax=Streptomyces massasporeus TaxID=67324 RepID=UPI0036C20A02